MRDTRESRLLLVLLVSVAFALITMDIRSGDNSPLDGAREAAASVFGPVEEGVAGAVDPVANAISAVRESGDRRTRISELERENAELRQQLGSEEHRDSRIEQLDEMLRTAGAGQYGIVGAQVIAIGAAQGFSWTVTIDAGSEDGLTRDMTVLNGDGLVGRVTTVGPGTATVLLANDPGFTVGTRLEGSEELGLATGRGDNTLDVQLINQQARVQEGDRMVTFGSEENRPFVPGVPVGEVVNVERSTGDLTRTVQVQPYVAFTQLDLVGVVVEPPRDNPRDSVLPPRPEDEARNEEQERDGDAGADADADADAGAADGGGEDDDPATRS
ncbi:MULTISPECIES: rod shape-determining protein MreC [unclassified Streptomyces]|uniref:Cell shape-determining protein MreC n=1 Tax=Streptomyces johnsoniae TaxID=3075532 RepID=A0ABU2SCT5_9ACTN|nr:MULTISPECIES: rod shape-determining protein MreC [unclassified Streptomyces]MDT0446787.1 rod shape-determining protein MreC [Streptomyces sp. DSM 41886]ONK14278.1 Rod shape-determining protein MreC [Streptomyces sp. MP131-18]